LTLRQKRTSRKRSKNGGDGSTGVYMRKGTTSRMTAAGKSYGEFYDFYVSPEYFGCILVDASYINELWSLGWIQIDLDRVQCRLL
jgi:hypothetical protein